MSEPSSASNMDANKDGGVQPDEQDLEEPTITLSDFLEEESKLESAATALLGHLDDKKCTYSLGYLDRQAIYACKTCTDGDTDPAGFCLACSYHCHEGHDILELYTKRFFRCDCGNSKFKDKKCNLEPEKSKLNDKNLYSQNFKGLYCVCSRPYPDPDIEVEEDCMIQCIICEDWYHSKHLNCDDVPSEEAYSEMICGSCTDKLPFLKHYLGFSVTKVGNKDDKPVDAGCETPTAGDIKKDKESTDETSVNNGDASKLAPTIPAVVDVNVPESSSNVDLKSKELPDETGSKIESNNCDRDNKINVPDSCESSKSESSASNGNASEKVESDASGKEVPSTVESSDKIIECLLKNYKVIETDKKGSATFWPENFRSLLCTCPDCEVMYVSSGVSWITDDKDTFRVYQEKGVKATEGTSGDASGAGDDASLAPTEQAMKAISHLDRFTQVEVIQNYINFESQLIDYLKSFARNKRVVREQDIHDFFNDIKARKRQKVDDGPSYYCR